MKKKLLVRLAYAFGILYVIAALRRTHGIFVLVELVDQDGSAQESSPSAYRRTSTLFPADSETGVNSSLPFYEETCPYPEHLTSLPNSTPPLALFETLASTYSNLSSNDSYHSPAGQAIPHLVHMTFKSRCLTQPYLESVQQWRTPPFDLLFHNDDDVDRLFALPWTQFPRLKDALHCLPNGPLKADIWRYLALWRWGGIYADTDNQPGWALRASKDKMWRLLRNKDAIVTVKQKNGRTPASFIAMSPHHPIMALAVEEALQGLWEAPDVSQIRAVDVTGPGALERAVRRFIGQDTGKLAAGHYAMNHEALGSHTTAWIRQSGSNKHRSVNLVEHNCNHLEQCYFEDGVTDEEKMDLYMYHKIRAWKNDEKWSAVNKNAAAQITGSCESILADMKR